MLNTLIYYLGEDTISKILLKNNFFGPFLASLVGLIPNCSASINYFELSELELKREGTTYTSQTLEYLNDTYPNDDFFFIKENFFILISIYLIGVLVGIIFDLLKISF